MSELLIGCGNSRRKKLSFTEDGWTDLTTIDHDPNCGADVLHELDQYPWPFADNTFDECHAYCVIEHLGQQGDYKAFFALFSEIYRILKPGGHLMGICPSWKSIWAFGDPSHTRVISSASLVFLDAAEYHAQVGKTAMTDFRWLWKGDFEPVHLDEDDNKFAFGLKAHKPARYQ